MIKHTILSVSVLSLSLLQACGGGGGGGDADPAESSLTGPTAAAQPAAAVGSVSARFVPGNNSRYLLLATNAQSMGNAEGSEQADSGAMVRLGSSVLSGPQQTLDIAGDAHFALGRWVKGTITQSADTSRTTTLTGKDEESYHYIAYNRLAELPTSGQLQCTTVAASAPTAVSDAREKVGAANGSANVSFTHSAAAIQGTIQVRAGAQTATVNLSTQIEDAASMSITGLLLGPGAGAGMVLADQGSEVPALVVAYRAQLPGGVLYNGVARFACNKT